MMKTLILLANEFPYGTWEPYLETEIKYCCGYDQVYICSLQLRDEHAKTIRQLPINAEVIPVRYVSRIRYLFGSFLVLFDPSVYIEIRSLLKDKKLKPGRLISLFVFLISPFRSRLPT